MIFLTAEFCMMEEKGKLENRAEFIVEGLKATGSHYKDLKGRGTEKETE